MTLSKNKIKEISKYELKKYRDEESVFIAEGPKLVSELLGIFTCKTLIATSEWIKNSRPQAGEVFECSEEELKKVSLLKSPQTVFAIFHKANYVFVKDEIKDKLCIALDDIQDPGNMGTIIRIADWFGIEHIFCSKHCADIYSPKTVQASMGAIARVKVYNVDLASFLAEQKKEMPIYGTFLDGENMYGKQLSKQGIIVMGNEGNGICDEVSAQINNKLFIPNYPDNRETSESLNVGVATAIICAEFRRKFSE